MKITMLDMKSLLCEKSANASHYLSDILTENSFVRKVGICADGTNSKVLKGKVKTALSPNCRKNYGHGR